ncbi:serine hydrolase [Nocardia sp. NPDC051570]|uniref:serine hydrolase n=1 Tax=Nocardia sp. NPDC051570 TaxID=3364324 RepID=UPI0037B54780
MSIEVKPVRRKGFRRSLLLVAVLAAAGCTANAGVPTADEEAIPTPVATLKPAAGALSSSGALAADFAQLQNELHGSVGMAIMQVGSEHALTLGNWNTGIAWSTIKVPLALAALRHDPAGLAETASAAITASDNDAAQALWEALGGGNQAAEAVEAVLRETGDTTTDVADRHNPAARESVDDPLAFGATVWTLLNQVRFASRLPCLKHAARVVDLMSEITASQSWGLGAFVGAEFKGGWGPDDDTGAYLVRQFGLVPTWSGQLAVALAAQPDSGSFDDATAMLDKLAALLAKHVFALGGGECKG